MTLQRASWALAAVALSVSCEQEVDVAAQCNDLDLPGEFPEARIDVRQEPRATGGPIADGIYDLKEVDWPLDNGIRIALELRGSLFRVAKQRLNFQGGGADPGYIITSTEYRANGTLISEGAVLKASSTCARYKHAGKEWDWTDEKLPFFTGGPYLAGPDGIQIIWSRDDGRVVHRQVFVRRR